MTDLAEREGLRPLIVAPGEQFIPAGDEVPGQLSPTTPVYRRGYYDFEDDEHDHHHEKRSVLAKVKDKAKKWRHMLAKKRHGHHEGSSPTSWEVPFCDEEEDQEQDPEYHGAPMYESEMAPDAYKEPSKGKAEPDLLQFADVNEGPPLIHLDAFKETPAHHTMANTKSVAEFSVRRMHEEPIKKSNNNKEDHPAFAELDLLMANAIHEDTIMRRSGNPFSESPRAIAYAKHEESIKETGNNKPNHLAFSEIDLLVANTKHGEPMKESGSIKATQHDAFSNTNLLMGKAKQGEDNFQHVAKKEPVKEPKEIGRSKRPLPASPNKKLLGSSSMQEKSIKNRICSKEIRPTSSDTELLMAKSNPVEPMKESLNTKRNHHTSSNMSPLGAKEKHKNLTMENSNNKNLLAIDNEEEELVDQNRSKHLASSNKHEEHIKEKISPKVNSPTFFKNDHLEATTKCEDLIAENSQTLLENILMAKAKHEEPVRERLQSKANRPASLDKELLITKVNPEKFSKDSSLNKGKSLMEANSKRGNPSRDIAKQKAYETVFPREDLLATNAKQKEYFIKESNRGKINHHAFSDTRLLPPRRNHEDPIKRANSLKANHPAFSNTKHGELVENHASNKTLTKTMSEILAPAYAMVSDTSHTIASKILCPTEGDEIGAIEEHDPVKELADTVSGMLSPAYSIVSDASRMIASKIQSPTESDEMGSEIVPNSLREIARDKTIKEAVTGMLTPVYTVVSNASHMIASKKFTSHKSFREIMSKILAPVYIMMSDASHRIATKIQGPSAMDEIRAKMAHDPNKKNTKQKTLIETVSEMLAPAYTMMSDASHKIATKIQGRAGGDEASTQQVWDKGVSVKEYLMQKLEPGEEDRALSRVITEVMIPRETEHGHVEEISMSEKVKMVVSSLLEREEHSEVTVRVSSLMVKKEDTNMVSSLVVKEEHAGSILPVSTHPHTVEIEEISGTTLEAY